MKILVSIIISAILFSCGDNGIDTSKFRDSESLPVKIRYSLLKDMDSTYKSHWYSEPLAVTDTVSGALFLPENDVAIYVNGELYFHNESMNDHIHMVPDFYTAKRKEEINKFELILDGKYYTFSDSSKYRVLEFHKDEDTLLVYYKDYLPMYD